MLLTAEDVQKITLAHLSPRDYRFKKWKTGTERMATELIGYDSRLSVKLGECATWLSFIQTEDTELKLRRANFCKTNICPLCSWRKRLIWLRRLYLSLNTIKCLYRDSRPKKKFKLIFLTLSQANCKIDDLSAELKKMNRAWDKYSEANPKQSPFYPHVLPADGYFRALEVTTKLNYNREIMCNAHFHILLVAKQGYGVKDKQTGIRDFYHHQVWLKAWRQAMQLDYDPTAHIKFIKFGKHSEIVKYLCKPLTYSLHLEKTLKMFRGKFEQAFPNRDSVYDSLFLGLHQQLRGVNQFTTGGIIRRYMPKRVQDNNEDDNLVNISDSSSNLDNQDRSLPSLFFRWQDGDYRLCFDFD